MKLQFWHDRWQQGQTGFHQNTINDSLLQYWSALVDDKAAVFVPLCGKSHDVLWLMQQGHSVVGVECSELAVDALFTANEITHNTNTLDSFTVYSNEKLTVYLGDYFSLEQSNLKQIKYVYDRASLIALPADMRIQYANHMTQLLSAGAKMMIVTLEYDQNLMQGPPFSVNEEEVESLYGSHYQINKLYQKDIIESETRFKSMGLNSLIETVYSLTKN